MTLQAAADAIHALAEADPATYADEESIVTVYRLQASFDAIVAAVTAAFDASGEWKNAGARDAASWLAKRCGFPKKLARRRVRIGRRMAKLPKFCRAWLAGEVTEAHVGAVGALLERPVLEEAMAAGGEQLLLEQAKELRYEAFVGAVKYFEQVADPDGADAAELERRDRRNFQLSESSDMWFGNLTLDLVSGAIFSGEHKRLEKGLFEADWQEASERLGRPPLGSELRRTGAQRRADALVEMATRSRSAPDDGRRPAPLFSVLVGYETLHGRICQLASGSVVAPAALLPWLSEAYIERAVFGPASRVEIGPAVRLYTGAMRRAIELRDRRCTHPYCDRPADECEVDHIIPWAQGGSTTQENGRLLCDFHNRLRNQQAQPPPHPPPEAA